MRGSVLTCLFLAALLSQPVHAEQVRLVVQSGITTPHAIAVSPDGKLVLTAEDSRLARIWHFETGRELRRFSAGLSSFRAAAFSADGNSAIAAADDGTIHIWDVKTGAETRNIELGGKGVAAVAISPDGHYAFALPFDAPAQFWDLRTGQLAFKSAKPLPLGKDVPKFPSVALSPSGHLAAIAGGKVVTVGDTTRFYSDDGLVGRFEHPSPVTAVAISPDESLLATAAEDKVIRIWNVHGGALLHELTGHLWPVSGVAFSPDSHTLVSGGSANMFRTWDTQTGKLIREAKQTAAFAFAFSSDGKLLFAGGPATAVALTIADGLLVQRFQGRANHYGMPAVFLRDGRIMLAVRRTDGIESVVWGGQGAPAKTKRLEKGGLFPELYPEVGYAVTIRSEWNPTKTEPGVVHVPTVKSSTVVLSRLEDGQTLAEFGNFDAMISSARLSPDGSVLVAVAGSGALVAWDVKSRREIMRTDTLKYALRVKISNDGRFAMVNNLDTVSLVRVVDGTEIRRWKSSSGQTEFAPDGALIKAGIDGTMSILDLNTGASQRRFETPFRTWANSLEFSPDGRRFAVSALTGTNYLIDYASGRVEQTWTANAPVIGMRFSPDGARLLTVGSDSMVGLRDALHDRSLADIVCFSDDTWAIVDEQGRYDASDPKGLPGIHWVLANEPIDLGQLKNRFWTPGLLSRILKGERLPDVPASFRQLDLYPAVKLDAPAKGSHQLKLQLDNQGGGLGRIVVTVNGRELPGVIRGGPDPAAKSAIVNIDLAAAIAAPDGKNIIHVAAYDAQGLVVSRGVTVRWETEAAHVDPPHLYALVAGVSRYSGPEAMNLKYAARDAADMAHALEVGGDGLFGPTRTHITLLSSDQPDTSLIPSKANFRRAFASIAQKASPGDTVVLYLAGHGLAHGNDTYFYLTEDARSLELDDPKVRENSTISSAELQHWLQYEVKALKHVIVLDTCAAGAANADLVKLAEKRELTADQIRAIELLNDAVGSHILMGSAADKVSYEAGRYGQGLLTYALLAGMKGEVQLDGGQLDVLRWFSYAQRKVEVLAQGIGGIQQPLLSSPQGRSFPVALLTDEAKLKIVIASPKPQVLRPLCLNATLADPLGLTAALRERLRDLSQPVTRGASSAHDAPLIYLDAVSDGLAGAISPRATYAKLPNGDVQVNLALIRQGDETVLHTAALTGIGADPRALASKIADEILLFLTRAPAAK